MKNHTLLFIILFFTTLSFAQTNFIDGFNSGYKKGYCQDQGIGCIDPIPPISPIPKVGESSDSYTDGYNRGFEMGLNARKSNSSSSSTSNGTRYQTSKPKFVEDVTYKAPVKLMSSALENLSRSAENNLRISNYKGVLDNTKSMISIYSDFDYAYFLGSYAYDKLGQLTNSYNYAMKARSLNLERHQEYSDTIYKKMQKKLVTLMSDNRFDEIIDITENFWYESNLGVLFKALGYYYQKDYKKSKKYFKKFKDNEIAKNYLKAIKNDHFIPNPYSSTKILEDKNEEKLLIEVEKLMREKKYDEIFIKLKPAIENIEQGSLSDQKTLQKIYTILAYSHYYKNNLAETIHYSTKAIDNSVSKEIGDFYFLRGLSKSNIGDYNGANKDYDYLIQNFKKINYDSNDLATLYNNKGYNLILLGKYKEAEPLVNKAINLDKTTDYIWETKGELEYFLGNYSNAVDAMSKSINIKPSASAYYFKGLSEIALGKNEKGCSDLSKAGEMGESKAYTEIKNNCN